MQQQSGPSQGMFQQQMPPRAGGGGGVRSLADLEQQKPPPQAPQDPTLEIKRLLNTGNLDAAFSSALGTSNLEIVSWLCSQVAPERVFGQHPCPLSPFVLLSLAQQLSSDLTTKDAERKLDWIRDTCLAIDPQDPALKLHVRPVLTAVYESLRKLGSSSQNISPSVKAAARLVVHVVNSLLSACP
jgi:enhancer of mRNA-decapping protein 4